MATQHPIARYVPLLIAGDLYGLLDLFREEPHVNDPRLGWVPGELFAQFVADSHEGLTERRAAVEHVATIATEAGAVEECVLSVVRRGSVVALPVAIVGETTSGSQLDSIRIYHSVWPLAGAHWLRQPVLPRVPGLALPDVIGRYHDCLARGDLSGILQQFEPEGVVREARGGPYVHRGSAALQQFFALLFANGGGMGLEYCSLTDDGAACALEYNVTSWGRSPLPRQAGAAVYERSATGRLAGVRMYDDVQSPLPAN